MTPEQWASLLASVGAGAILIELIRAFWKWIGGKAGRERDAVALERTRADTERKVEARRRRKAQEYAAKLRRVSIEHGIPASDLPPWPTELID